MNTENKMKKVKKIKAKIVIEADMLVDNDFNNYEEVIRGTDFVLEPRNSKGTMMFKKVTAWYVDPNWV